jgi:hypothetical protein
MATSAPKEVPLLPPDGPLPESGPLGYSRSTPDPKHRGAATRHSLKPLWLTAEHAEMDGLINRKVWLRVCETFFLVGGRPHFLHALSRSPASQWFVHYASSRYSAQYVHGSR